MKYYEILIKELQHAVILLDNEEHAHIERATEIKVVMEVFDILCVSVA